MWRRDDYALTEAKIEARLAYEEGHGLGQTCANAG